MSKFLSILGRIDNYLFKVQKVLILIGVVAMVIINGAQVFCRYVVRASLGWSEQTSVLLFFILIMLGANLAVKTDTETKIDILQFKNCKANAALRLVTDIISCVALVVFLMSSVALLKQARALPQLLSSIRLDYFYIYIWLLVGFAPVSYTHLTLLVGFALILFDKIINIFKNIFCLLGKELPEEFLLPENPDEEVAE